MFKKKRFAKTTVIFMNSQNSPNVEVNKAEDCGGQHLDQQVLI